MRTIRSLIVFLVLVLLLFGCDSKQGNLSVSDENTPDNIVDESEEAPYSEESADSTRPSQEELPGSDGDTNEGQEDSTEASNNMKDDSCPTGELPPDITPEMLGLNSLDAALFSASLSCDLPYTSDIGMTIPYIETYGQYVENDSIHIVGRVWYMRHYYDPEQNAFSKGGTFIPYFGATVKETESGTYICESFEISQDGRIEEDLRAFCGPLTDLTDQIFNHEVTAESTFPSSDEMRAMYAQETGIEFTFS